MKIKERSSKYRAQLFNALLLNYPEQGAWSQVFQLLSQGQRAARNAGMAEVEQQLEQGQEMVLQGLKASDKFVDAELPIIELGVATGDVRRSFQRLRDLYVLQDRFAQELRQQFKFPLVAAFVVLGLMNGGMVVEQLLTVPRALIYWLASVLFLLVLAWSAIRFFCAVAFASGLASQWLRVIPVLGEVIRSGQLLHFFNNLGQCVTVNIPLSQALKLSAQKLPSRYYREHFSSIYRAVVEGSKLSAALSASRVLKGVSMTSLPVAGADVTAVMAHISDAVQTHYAEYLSLLTRWIPQIVYLILPLIAFLQVASL